MCKEFFDRYSKFGIEPAVLRDIYRFATDDESAGSSQKEEEVDQHLVNFILESNDTDLLWDLRKLNSHPKKKTFDSFWHELQKYIHEFAAVDERKHSDILYLPVATSIENISQIFWIDILWDLQHHPFHGYIWISAHPVSIIIVHHIILDDSTCNSGW